MYAVCWNCWSMAGLEGYATWDDTEKHTDVIADVS